MSGCCGCRMIGLQTRVLELGEKAWTHQAEMRSAEADVAVPVSRKQERPRRDKLGSGKDYSHGISRWIEGRTGWMEEREVGRKGRKGSGRDGGAYFFSRTGITQFLALLVPPSETQMSRLPTNT